VGGKKSKPNDGFSFNYSDAPDDRFAKPASQIPAVQQQPGQQEPQGGSVKTSVRVHAPPGGHSSITF
jgi:hypothetical protein